MMPSEKRLVFARAFSQSQSSSEEDFNALSTNQQGRPQNFGALANELKASRQLLRQFIQQNGPTEDYRLDLTKYDSKVIDPRVLNVNCNADILHLADISIQKSLTKLFRMFNNKRFKKNWSKQDTAVLVWLLDKRMRTPESYVVIGLIQGEDDWKALAEMIPGKNYQQAMFKWMSIKTKDKAAQKREWTAREDAFLKSAVQKFGNKSWYDVSRQLYYDMGKSTLLYRAPKLCRERWVCHLDSRIQRGPWRVFEDIMLVKEYLAVGGKWSRIAAKLSSRTENAIKNRFSLLLAKKTAFDKKKSEPSSNEAYLSHLLEELEAEQMKEIDEAESLSLTKYCTQAKKSQKSDDCLILDEEIEECKPSRNYFGVGSCSSKEKVTAFEPAQVNTIEFSGTVYKSQQECSRQTTRTELEQQGEGRQLHQSIGQYVAAEMQNSNINILNKGEAQADLFGHSHEDEDQKFSGLVLDLDVHFGNQFEDYGSMFSSHNLW